MTTEVPPPKPQPPGNAGIQVCKPSKHGAAAASIRALRLGVSLKLEDCSLTLFHNVTNFQCPRSPPRLHLPCPLPVTTHQSSSDDASRDSGIDKDFPRDR